MKNTFLALLLTLFLSSCSLWPSGSQNELERLSEDVLKSKGQGIEIDVKPIDKASQTLHSNAPQNRSSNLFTMPD